MKIIRKSDGISNFVIYELNEEETQLVENKFRKRSSFYVASGEFCDFYMKNHTFKDIIEEKKCVSPIYYLGFFQTYLEAYYHIKLIEATSMIDQMEWKMKEALSIETFDKDGRMMITDKTDKLNVLFYPLTESEPDTEDHLEFLV